MFFIDGSDLVMVTNSNQWNLYVGRITPRGKVIWSIGINDLPDIEEIKKSANLFISSLK